MCYDCGLAIADSVDHYISAVNAFGQSFPRVSPVVLRHERIESGGLPRKFRFLALFFFLFLSLSFLFFYEIERFWCVDVFSFL